MPNESHLKYHQQKCISNSRKRNKKMKKRIEIVSPNFATALGDDASSPNCSRHTQKTITHTPGMPERELNIDIYICIFSLIYMYVREICAKHLNNSELTCV